ncbi:hypothetical protein Q8A73_005413 [Channa argus]|nr:hypothetical protein Q8A73_005413 [Channa argus]
MISQSVTKSNSDVRLLTRSLMLSLPRKNRKTKENENGQSMETVRQKIQGSSDRRPFQTFSFTQKPCEKLPCQGEGQDEKEREGDKLIEEWFLAEVQALASFCSDFLYPALSQISTLKAFMLMQLQADREMGYFSNCVCVVAKFDCSADCRGQDEVCLMNELQPACAMLCNMHTKHRLHTKHRSPDS